jgi:hypothetical protein
MIHPLFTSLPQAQPAQCCRQAKYAWEDDRTLIWIKGKNRSL